MALFGGQTVVNPAAWAWPSDHSVWNSNWFCVTHAPLSYSGATANGSASGFGMAKGLLTEEMVMNRQFEAAWKAFTSAAKRVWLRPSWTSASRRLRLGPNAWLFCGPLNPPQTNQSPWQKP